MEFLGRINYYRGKGQQWVEMIRSWVTPVVMGGGAAKYLLGLDGIWAIAIAIAVPILVESGGAAWGWFLYKRGAVFADYELALKMDPFKRQSLERLEAIEILLARIQHTNAATLGMLQESRR